jgi:hypothetical protein
VLVPEKERERERERENLIYDLGATVREREEPSSPAKGSGVASRDW